MGTVGLAWISSRYWSVDRRMSLERFSLPGSVSTRGTLAVTGETASIRRASTPARRAMNSRTGALAMTLPRRSARVVNDVKS